MQKKADLDRKIAGLEAYLGKESSGGKHAVAAPASVRGGVDIRPFVRDIFAANGNEPLRLKEIADRVEERTVDVARNTIERKMVHVKRTMLENTQYGTYRLRGPYSTA